MFVEENSASIYLRDRSMRSGTKLAREIQLTDWSTAGNLGPMEYKYRVIFVLYEVQLDNKTCYLHVWRYEVFARKLTWYFTGVYVINSNYA